MAGINADSPLAKFLSPVISLAHELSAKGLLKGKDGGMMNLIEENVRRSVDTISKTDTLVNAWAAGKPSRSSYHFLFLRSDAYIVYFCHSYHSWLGLCA